MHNLYTTNGGGGTQSEDYTYVSFYESATTGWPSDGPINRRAHINPSYYPTMTWGDAPSSDSTYYTSNHWRYNLAVTKAVETWNKRC